MWRLRPSSERDQCCVDNWSDRDYKTEKKTKGRLPFNVLFSSLKNCKILILQNDYYIIFYEPTSSAKKHNTALTPVVTGTEHNFSSWHYYFSFDFNYSARLYLLAWLHWAGQDGQPDGSETNSLTAKIKITQSAMTFWSGYLARSSTIRTDPKQSRWLKTLALLKHSQNWISCFDELLNMAERGRR